MTRKVAPNANMQRYQVSVSTGTKPNAGTDADVSIVLVGELGSSTETRLNSKKNNFEKGQVRRRAGQGSFSQAHCRVPAR